GNQPIHVNSLKAVIATQENSIMPFSRSHYFDRPEFERDLQRIEAYYADHGYPHAKVTGVDVKLNNAKDHVDITVNITEGTPTIVESIAFEGFDPIPAAHLAELKAQTPIVPGEPRNQTLILAAHDLAENELRDHGLAYGTVKIVERPGAAPDRVQLAFVADTGPSAVFGAISIEGNVSVDEN